MNKIDKLIEKIITEDNFCNQCGIALLGDEYFCPECGAEVEPSNMDMSVAGDYDQDVPEVEEPILNMPKSAEEPYSDTFTPFESIIERYLKERDEKYYLDLLKQALKNDKSKIDKYLKYVRDTYGRMWWDELEDYSAKEVIANMKDVFSQIYW